MGIGIKQKLSLFLVVYHWVSRHRGWAVAIILGIVASCLFTYTVQPFFITDPTGDVKASRTVTFITAEGEEYVLPATVPIPFSVDFVRYDYEVWHEMEGESLFIVVEVTHGSRASSDMGSSLTVATDKDVVIPGTGSPLWAPRTEDTFIRYFDDCAAYDRQPISVVSPVTPTYVIFPDPSYVPLITETELTEEMFELVDSHIKVLRAGRQ